MAKLKWGMIGGGEGSQIGPAHRLGSGIDGLFEFAAGALDHRPAEGREYGQRLGLAADRSYGNWQEMLDGEKNRDDRVDLVTVATPNSTHFEITKAFLEAGFNVLCEKPMTMTVDEGEQIVKLAQGAGRICAVNYGYSGYSLVRHMRAMVARGDLGKIRLVMAEFATAIMPMQPMRTIRAYAGVTIPSKRAYQHNLPIAAFMPCTWPALSPDRKWPNFLLIPSPASKAGSLKTMPWSTSAWMAAPLDAFGPLRSPLAGNMVWAFRSLVKKAACAGARSNPTSSIICLWASALRSLNAVLAICRRKRTVPAA